MGPNAHKSCTKMVATRMAWGMCQRKMRLSQKKWWVHSALILGLLSGCGERAGSTTPNSASVPTGSVSAPAFDRAAPTSDPAAVEPGGDAEPAGSAEPASSAEPAASAAPAESAEPVAELPPVDVKNVGMHIGGEANTAAQKRPIRSAVSKHYDDMRRCYAKASSPPKNVTFGVDMRIDGDGGPPKVSNPRSGIKGEARDCIVGVFEHVDFPRQPKGVARMVSFSIEFRNR